MNACTKPCKQCPFRKDSLAGWLADYTPQDLHNIVMNELEFPCHMTHETDISFEEAASNKYPLCAGALGYMRKNAKKPRKPELAELVSRIDKEILDDILSVSEFFDHHTKKYKAPENANYATASRTHDEVVRQIEGLYKMKENLPEISSIGTKNWEYIDAQIDVLEGSSAPDDYYQDETGEDYQDGDNEVYFEAVKAEQWLDGECNEDLFEID